METRLSQFCRDFDVAIRPLLAPVQRVADNLNESSSSLAVREVLPDLLDASHKLAVLIEKVAGQQAYALIFGPLKSGKSTLMNALTSAYVSEVTSLPAYPCLVYVSHAETPEFVLTRYNGGTESLSDPTVLRDRIGEAHKALATRLRQVEGLGERFDPGVHFPEAIRRVDVKIPAGDLEESGAVLVDTPGLYARMRFGYDRMTRDFRDTAACAVFVVKTDNLFLEQVFEEFNKLLEIFSRIFLVVNIDSSKRDLASDGGLVPSIERDNPNAVIEAFENLAMSAPLKKAAEEGRLRICPVDLLRAASSRLRAAFAKSQSKARGVESGDEIQVTDLDDPGPAESADFQAFLRELTDYLNSTDYLNAFLRDSLRYCRNLLRDLLTIADHEQVRDLEWQVKSLKTELEREEALAKALAKSAKFDWKSALNEFDEEFRNTFDAQVAELSRRAHRRVQEIVAAWFKGSSSLQRLTDGDLGGLLHESQTEMGQAALEILRGTLVRDLAGLTVPSDIRRDLDTAGMKLPALARTAFDRVEVRPMLQRQTLPVPYEEIPIRKQLMDWVLFRSQSTIRQKLFGSEERPDAPLPASQKAKHLGDPAEDFIRDHAERGVESFIVKMQRKISEHVLGDFGSRLLTALEERLTEDREACNRRLGILRAKLLELQQIDQDVLVLQGKMKEGLTSVADLARRYEVPDLDGPDGARTFSAPKESRPTFENTDVARRLRPGLESDRGVPLEVDSESGSESSDTE